MDTTSPPQETAHLIVRILVYGLKLRGGQGAPLGTVMQKVMGEDVNVANFRAGLLCAIDRGWIQYDEVRRYVGLTEDGFAAA